jgi:N-acetylmuramoyl-L-alanine amidase
VLKPSIVLVTVFSGLVTFSTAGIANAPAGEQTVYLDAGAKEKAVRSAMSNPQAQPTVLKAVRTVVSQYEMFVRDYPKSAFSDDALWAGARLSIDAFKKFGDAVDKEAGARLLRALAAAYPATTFAKQVPGLIASLERTQPPIATASPDPTTPTEPASTPAPRSVAPPNVVQAPSAPPTAPLPSTSKASQAPPATRNRPPASKVVQITGIRRSTLPDVVRIVVDLDGEVPFEEDRLSNPSRVFVDLASSAQNQLLIDKTQAGTSAGERIMRFDGDADLVRQVRIGRHANNVTRIVLDAEGVSSYSVYPLYSPYRLVIDCIRARPAAATAAPTSAPVASNSAPPPIIRPPLLPHRALFVKETAALATGRPENAALIAAAVIPPPVETVPLAPLPVVTVPSPPQPVEPSKNIAGGFSIARQLGLSVSRIVIDPGHGGHDPGAKGNGQTEADLVLTIALALEKLLGQLPGVDVVLTRRTDEYVSLQERTAIANRENADLFLSIHANAHRNKQIGGVETYFLNFATNPTAEAVAARENAASMQAMGDAPTLIKAIALNNKLDESKDFATMVQTALVRKLRPANKGLKDHGVKQAPFVVLIGATMPSVLAEVSFLTSTQDARLLKTPAYQQRIAEALFDGIRAYQTSLKKASTVAERTR